MAFTYIERHLGPHLHQLAEWYPVVSVTGPRQSGKSTLVRESFPEYDYVNVEDPQIAERAATDPSGFVRALEGPTIIDEAQRVPELFSAIQAQVDQSHDTGQFILSGSQNFLLLTQISQSLAGRVGIARLLPLSYLEESEFTPATTPETAMLRGSYPIQATNNVPPEVFFANYVDTYVSRDVAGYLNVRNTASFRVFLVACAARAGSLVNYSDLARDVGINVATAKAWLSILEASYIVTRLTPSHANVTKRLIKAPKLYFLDTGLLCHLLNIRTPRMLAESPHRGAIFENYVISEQHKRHLNALRTPQLSFYRDTSGIEADLVDTTIPGQTLLCELKAGLTYRSSFARHVRSLAAGSAASNPRPSVVYGGEGRFVDDGVDVWGLREWLAEDSALAAIHRKDS